MRYLQTLNLKHHLQSSEKPTSAQDWNCPGEKCLKDSFWFYRYKMLSRKKKERKKEGNRKTHKGFLIFPLPSIFHCCFCSGQKVAKVSNWGALWPPLKPSPASCGTLEQQSPLNYLLGRGGVHESTTPERTEKVPLWSVDPKREMRMDRLSY